MEKEDKMGTVSSVSERRYRPELVHGLFGKCITDRHYIPGRENYDKVQEKRRERTEFMVINDYIEQA